jgi:phage shock protein A
MTPALVRNFAVSNIYTVEQLASLSDNAIQAVGMGTREWKTKAQAYLDRAAEGAGASALAAENEQLKNDLAAMKQQLAAVAQQVAESAAKAEAAPVAAPAITAEQIAALVAGEVAKATAAINTRPVNDDVAPATGKGAKAA